MSSRAFTFQIFSVIPPGKNVQLYGAEQPTGVKTQQFSGTQHEAEGFKIMTDLIWVWRVLDHIYRCYSFLAANWQLNRVLCLLAAAVPGNILITATAIHQGWLMAMASLLFPCWNMELARLELQSELEWEGLWLMNESTWELIWPKCLWP